MKVITTSLEGVLIIEPLVHADDRGFFTESFQAERYTAIGLPPFVQDNLAGSRAGVLRGLHYQWPRSQGKLVQVLSGSVLDVAVDLRRGSPGFGRWVAVELNDVDRRQLFIPEGFAHGYSVLSEWALVAYKCTTRYVPENERSIRWNDPDLGIRWPVDDPILSDHDREAPFLRDLAEEALPGEPSVLP